MPAPSAVALVRLAPSHSRLLPIRVPRRLMAPSAVNPLRSRTEPPISAVSAASTTPLPSSARFTSRAAVHVERAGDARAHQPDHAGSDEAVAQDHHAVEARRLGADRVALAGADPRAAGDHVAGHVRGVQRDAADRGEPAHQVEAAADRRPRQPQRIACIAMRDAGARRRDLQAGAAAQQIAVDHRGMRVDPGGVRQRGDAGDVERAVDPHAARPHFADAAVTQATAAPGARWSGRSASAMSHASSVSAGSPAPPGPAQSARSSNPRCMRRGCARQAGGPATARAARAGPAADGAGSAARSTGIGAPANIAISPRAVRAITSASASSRTVGSKVRTRCSSGIPSRR